MTRRSFIHTAAAAGLVPAMPAAGKQTSLGFTPASTLVKQVRDPAQYFDYVVSLGFGGCQIGVSANTPVETIHDIRRRAEAAGMYLEGSTGLARNDAAEFESRLKKHQELGATSFRTTCLSGRRYEDFNTLGEWREAAKEFKRRLALAVPVCDRLKIKMGVENHKDWTVEDFLGLLKEYESEYFGVCLDMGNNVSLLDDPHEVVDALGPYAVNMHIKDIGVQLYEDGYLKSQLPLGTGCLDLKRIAATLKRLHPKINFSLEMMTRDALKIPCLTDKYWATFPDRSGRYLARALNWAKKNSQTLPVPSSMPPAQREQLEQENFRKSIVYARDVLGLV